jgi:hypothetical protein
LAGHNHCFEAEVQALLPAAVFLLKPCKLHNFWFKTSYQLERQAFGARDDE